MGNIYDDGMMGEIVEAKRDAAAESLKEQLREQADGLEKRIAAQVFSEDRDSLETQRALHNATIQRIGDLEVKVNRLLLHFGLANDGEILTVR